MGGGVTFFQCSLGILVKCNMFNSVFFVNTSSRLPQCLFVWVGKFEWPSSVGGWVIFLYGHGAIMTLSDIKGRSLNISSPLCWLWSLAPTLYWVVKGIRENLARQTPSLGEEMVLPQEKQEIQQWVYAWLEVWIFSGKLQLTSDLL